MLKKLLFVLPLCLILYLPTDATTFIHCVYVGQGDSTFIESAGKTLVIDTGPSEAHEVLAAEMQALGVQCIDALILTHPHADHDGNFSYLVENYPIGTLYMPEYANDEEDYGGLLRQAVAQGTQIRYPVVGDQFAVGDATATILSAGDPAQYPDDKNLWSIVTKIEDGATSIIVAGDAEDINEYAMIDAGLDLNADVLRIGHHGSYTSTTGAFLDAVKPDVAVISCGSGNEYGHPHQEILDALWKHGVITLRTDLSGTIRITTDGTSYRVQMERRVCE